jgi:fibronectin type 3 domain-containing protein
MKITSALTIAVLSATFATVTASPAAAALPAGGMAASAVASMFNTYGDAGNHWTGADSTVSVPLPDGRVAWLFSDTFLGTVNADGSRPTSTPMVNNTIVVQDGTSLVSTRTGGTAALPEALVKPSQAGEFYWVGDGTIENGALKVIYNRYKKTGDGGLDFALTGSALATFALPALTVTSVVDLPVSTTIGWGSAILEDGAYTYIYGTSSTADHLKFAHVARVPAGGLGGAWQFWTGTAWSATESAAARLFSGVGTGFGVQQVNGQYVLVTQENNAVFDPQFVAYTAASPTGPFTGPVQLFKAPEQESGSPVITYDSRVHPELARSGKLLVSYNVNSLVNNDNYTNARLYRPRFVEVDWPRPVPSPSTLPATPGGFTATVDAAGIGTLTWQAASGATGYRIHRRDVTAGQTHFARQPSPVTGTSAEVGAMVSGHRYEFKITAENAVGESPFSATLSLTPQIVAPPAPTGLTVAANVDGQVTLSWSAVPAVWNYEVFQRDVTEGETEATSAARTNPGVTTTTLNTLDNGHQYEFYVIASHGGGASPPSAKVLATAAYTMPGTPTGLTATANSDGTISLAWTAPAPNLYYWVYQRDVTAAETEFTQLPIPITTGTSMTAGLLINGHQYEYKVSAINKAGEGTATAPVRATATFPPPAPPTGLTAVAGSGEVKLTWTESPTANVWYWVYQRDVTAGETEFTQLPLPVSVCCTITPGWLTDGHTYEYKVTSTGAGGESAATAVVRATPQVPLPGQVTGLTVTSNTDGTLKVAWTSADENVYFDVYMRDVTAGETTLKKLGLPATCCSFNAGYLTNSHVYEFKIAAINSAGSGPQSAAARGTSRYSPPAAPPNLRGESQGDGTITLDWDAPGAGGFYYWIYSRDVTAGQTTFTKGGLPTDKTAADLGPYINGHDYDFKVTAENSGGEGPASDTVRVTSRGGVPAKPTNLTATAGDGEVALKWTASSTASVLYNVYTRDDSAGGSWQKLKLPVDGTSMTAGYLTNGHTYSFKVTAANISGASAASNVATAKPMPPLPKAPSGLTATAGDGKVALKWTASSTPSVFYWIETRSKGGGWQRAKYPLSTCCSFTVSYLGNGTTYDFRVIAENLAGESSASNVASARPMPPSPQPPTNLTATAGNGKVVLKWTASSTANVWYILEMRAKGGTWQPSKYPISTCCSFTVSYLMNGTTYEFRLRSTNLSGDSAPSNTDSAKPMPPKPVAPTLYDSIVEEPGRVKLNWSTSPTPDVWYWVYYRNATHGHTKWAKFEYPVPGTWADLYGLFTPGDAYEFKIAAFNVAGEDRSNGVLGVPRRFMAFYAGTRKRNIFNGSNTYAGLWALARGMRCVPDYQQTVCFGAGPGAGDHPMTIGDYLFYPHSQTVLEDTVARNTRDTAQMRMDYGWSISDSRGPNLLRHEAVHSEQYADSLTVANFFKAYAGATAASIAAGKGPACANYLEVRANLWWGEYMHYPSTACK